jgi:hypothetical protein
VAVSFWSARRPSWSMTSGPSSASISAPRKSRAHTRGRRMGDQWSPAGPRDAGLRGSGAGAPATAIRTPPA